MPLWPSAVAICVISVASTPSAVHPQAPDVIRGIITDEAGRGLAAAEVILTIGPHRATMRTQADSTGRYLLRVEDATGDYLVHISAVGYRPFRKRLTRADPLAKEFELNVQLEPAVVELAPSVVEATATRPERGDDLTTEPGSAAQFADGVTGVVAPSDQGVLLARLRMLPGVQPNALGPSVLGLSPLQMKTSLNGVAFRGSEIPREARTRLRMHVSSYDPARGGFSAGEAALDLEPGGEYSDSRSHVTVNTSPFLSSSIAHGGAVGSTHQRQVSIGSNGSFAQNKMYYNAGIQASRENSAPATITRGRSEVLRSLGISPDSASAFRQVVRDLGIEDNLMPASGNRVASNGSAILRIDYKPFENAWDYQAKSTWALIAYARFSDRNGLGFEPTATAGFGGKERSTTTMLSGDHALYWGKDFLTQTRSAFSRGSEHAQPYSALPSGYVFVSREGGNEGPPGAWLQFGGNSTLRAYRRWSTWETSSETQFYVADRRQPHKLKVYAQVRYDEDIDREVSDDAAFSFASLEDLRANVPAAFTRRYGGSPATSRLWSGAFTVGDLWRRSRHFSVLYGLRAEAYGFVSTPSYNARIESLFGERNDRVPASIYVSPRFGFTWIYSRRTGNQDRYSISDLAAIHSGPVGSLRGGIGEFRALPDANWTTGAVRNPGIGGGSAELACVGMAAPRPDWAAYLRAAGSLPSECAPGSPAFATVAPSVELVGADVRPPRSWRANLAWTSSLRGLDFGIEGIYSLNLDQPGLLDLNFDGTPKMTLQDEAGRPVFTEAAAIVPATAMISPAGAKITSEYAGVLKHHSGNKSVSRQLTVTLTPHVPSGRYVLRAAYNLLGVRERSSGFTVATRGDPREMEWADAPVSRHQFQIQGGVALNAMSATAHLTVASGVPFTPIVAGDVNGDGQTYNDRAFVFDAGASRALDNPEVLQMLVYNSPGRISRCLQNSLGRIARRNSCSGPWTANLNANVTLSRGLVNRWFHTGDRVEVALNLENLLSAADRILHGSRSRGWGGAPMVDPMLYRARSFQSVERRFMYEANARFGRSDPRIPGFHRPFRLTIDVALAVGPPRAEQQLNRALRPGRSGLGVKLSVDSLKKRYARAVPDIYRAILAETDSLLLTEMQVNAMVGAQDRYLQRMDSVWTDLATYLANLDHNYNSRQALARQETTLDEAWEIAWREVQRLPRIISPVQLRLLPWPANWLYAAKRPLKGIRFY